MHLEHVNMTVADLERSIAFYSRLLGLKVRWQGTTRDGQPAAHIGDDRCYLALFQAREPSTAASNYDQVGMNHFGFVVDDLEATRMKAVNLGVQPHLEGAYDPGRRFYIYDPDGIELELVEYAEASTGA